MNKNWLFCALLLALSAVAPSVVHAQALPALQNHRHLNVLPVAAVAPNLKVDGELSEWRPDAFVAMYADEDLREVFAVRMALAYDQQNLYVAAHVTDSSPLVNLIDPRVQPFDGWRGDALQMRLVTDPKVDHPIPSAILNTTSIAHLTMWQYSREDLPALDVRFGMNYQSAVTLTGADSGLVYRAEPGGYAVEGSIPWTVLKAEPPQPGQTMRMTMQALWGDAQGKMVHHFFNVMRGAGFHFQRPDGWGEARFIPAAEAAAVLAAQDADEKRFFAAREKPPVYTIPVVYTNPRKGYVSLAIRNARGQIVRTLLARQQREAGPQREEWDGRDDDGKPVAPGEYSLSALTHPGITPRYVTSVMQSGDPAWDNSAWGADHGVPVAAASDGQGFSYLAWSFNESGNFLLRVDRSGRKQWGAKISWGDFHGNATAILHDGNDVYAAKDGVNTKGDVSEGGLFRYEAATGRRINFPDSAGKFLITKWPKQVLEGEGIRQRANLVGLAASPDSVFCALHLENRIVELDKKTWKERRSFAVARPLHLAYDARRQRLLAVSKDSVVAFDLARGGARSTLIGAGLTEPWGIALDPGGNIFVSTRGAQMQVLVFDANGRLRRRIGKTGGRPSVGRYDPNGMYQPAGITVDTAGQLWVTESDYSPERISVWNTRNGRLAREHFGTPSYAPMMAPDPDRPEHVYMHNVRFRVDYDKGTWYPEATVYRQGYLGGPMIPGSEQGYGWMGNTLQVRRFNGRTFAYQGHGGVLLAEGDTWKPLTYIGAATPDFPEPTKERTPVVWRDRNGNGLIEAAEVTPVPGAAMNNNIAQFGGTFFPGGSFIKGKRLYEPSGLDTNGIPIYPAPADAPPILQNPGEMGAYTNWLDVWPSRKTENTFYAIASLPHPTNPRFRSGGAGDGIFRFDRQGNIQWRYARSVVDFAIKNPPLKSPGLSKPGDLFGALRIAGLVEMPPQQGGEIVGIGVYRGYFSFLSENGLFIDQIGHEPGRAPKPNFDTFFIENFSGYVFKHPRTGKVYLFAGSVDGRILELNGWENIRVFDAGNLQFTAEQAQAAAALENKPNAPGPTAALQAARFAPAVDGRNDEWKNRPLASISLDETRKAQGALAYDASNLYVMFEVPDSSPWQNSSIDWRFAFKGGDAVDIHLGAVHTDRTKRGLMPGDVRILLSPAGASSAQAIAMWPLVPAGMVKEPLLYKSPTGEEPFERVSLLTDVKSSVTKSADGYTLEAAIPWRALGIAAPAEGSHLQGDVGVLLSDAAGTQTILRRYLFNQDTRIVNDIPNEVRLLSHNWGRLEPAPRP